MLAIPLILLIPCALTVAASLLRRLADLLNDEPIVAFVTPNGTVYVLDSSR